MTAIASPSTASSLTTHRGNAMLLHDYGIHIHMAAVVVELCVGPNVNMALHNMLIAVRAPGGCEAQS